MLEQHGFRPVRPATACNVTFCNYIFDAFNTYSQVDAIYTDCEETFTMFY